MLNKRKYKSVTINRPNVIDLDQVLEDLPFT